MSTTRHDPRLSFRASPDTRAKLDELRGKLSRQIGAEVSMSQAMRSAIVTANDLLDAAEPLADECRKAA